MSTVGLVPPLTYPVVMVVVLGTTVAVRSWRRRAGRPVPPVTPGLLVRCGATALVGLIPLLISTISNRQVRHVLDLLPLAICLVLALLWLIRNRKGIAEGWKAETEEDRSRGLTWKRK